MPDDEDDLRLSTTKTSVSLPSAMVAIPSGVESEFALTTDGVPLGLLLVKFGCPSTRSAVVSPHPVGTHPGAAVGLMNSSTRLLGFESETQRLPFASTATA